MVKFEPNDLHFEPFVHLVDVTEQSALIGWGGFFLRLRDEAWCLVDDDDLPGERRFYAADPFGNRLEFLAERASPAV